MSEAVAVEDAIANRERELYNTLYESNGRG